MGSVWSTFIDIKVTQPNCTSNGDKTLKQIYEEHETEKRKYNEVLNVERGNFTHLVFLTTGGMSPECVRFLNRLAELQVIKKTRYQDVVGHLRTRIRFALLRSSLVAFRGYRGKACKDISIPDVYFGLIPAPPPPQETGSLQNTTKIYAEIYVILSTYEIGSRVLFCFQLANWYFKNCTRKMLLFVCFTDVLCAICLHNALQFFSIQLFKLVRLMRISLYRIMLIFGLKSHCTTLSYFMVSWYRIISFLLTLYQCTCKITVI